MVFMEMAFYAMVNQIANILLFYLLFINRHIFYAYIKHKN